MTYIDRFGAEFFVQPGFGSDGKSAWVIARLERDRSKTRRTVQWDFPARQSEAEAQADLDAYASKKDWWKQPGLFPTA
jgi:hypothetical protein